MSSDDREQADIYKDLTYLYIPGIDHEHNYSMFDLLDPSSKERGFFTSANVGIFLCLCGIAFNIILITLILGSRSLRNRYIYVQILNIAIADLGFVVTVDCITVYSDMHRWTLGVNFCKAWILLDVTLPTVSIVGVLLLNADRILFIYKTSLYQMIMKRLSLRTFVLLFPWCISTVLVCGLWLGFSELEPEPDICMYGITKEANSASTWLTVFLPAIFIAVLIVFVFIASLGDMPSHGLSAFHTNNHNFLRREEFMLVRNTSERSQSHVTMVNSSTDLQSSHPSHHRRVVLCVLAVDFISLLLTLPFTAFSHVSPVCKDKSSCESLMILFQSLSWMRSSVTSFRPLLFILLTEARFVCVREEDFCCRSQTDDYRTEEDLAMCRYNESVQMTNLETSSSHFQHQSPVKPVASRVTPPLTPKKYRVSITSSASLPDTEVGK